jgi:hypothetical protein
LIIERGPKKKAQVESDPGKRYPVTTATAPACRLQPRNDANAFFRTVTGMAQSFEICGIKRVEM